MERAPTDWATVFAASLLTFAAAPAAAEAPIYKGAQFQVNSETDGRQAYSAAAAAADGDFIVVWRDRFEITGQRYDSNGAAQGSEFHIGTVSTQYHSNFPSVAAAPDGDFVVVWDGLPDLEIHGRRFAADGSPKDASFQVNTYTTGDQEHASVAVAANGDFIAVWNSVQGDGTDTSVSIQGQRYASDGSPLGAQFQVNTYTTGLQRFPRVAADAAGDFVVVWQHHHNPSAEWSIRGQRYAADGTPEGAEFEVNSSALGSVGPPSVASAPGGDFVVVWSSEGSLGTDSTSPSIQGRRYASDGSAQGPQFQANIYTTGDQQSPTVAAAENGDFVVVWSDAYYPGMPATHQGQRFASDGSPVGSQFQVNTYPTDFQFLPSVAAADDGDFVVTWSSLGSPGPDTSDYSVQARIFTIGSVPALSRWSGLALGATLLLVAAHVLRPRA